MDEDSVTIILFAFMVFISVFGFVFWVCLQEFIDYKRKFYQQRKEIIKGEKDGE